MSRSMRSAFLPLAAGLVLVAGCGAPLQRPGYGYGDAPAHPTAAQRDSALAGAPQPGRPGLGTSWGETRHSEVTHTAFERADEGSPTAIGSFYYNDRQGAEAMAGRDDFRRLAEAVFQLPGLPVTVSIPRRRFVDHSPVPFSGCSRRPSVESTPRWDRTLCTSPTAARSMRAIILE